MSALLKQGFYELKVADYKGFSNLFEADFLSFVCWKLGGLTWRGVAHA